MRLAAIFILGLTGTMAVAEEVITPEGELPDVEQFVGLYERIGRTSREDPQLVSDFVQIVVASDGISPQLLNCGDGGDSLEVWGRLGHLMRTEQPNDMTMPYFAEELRCEYYPDATEGMVIICQSDGGLLWTLMPTVSKRAVDCAG